MFPFHANFGYINHPYHYNFSYEAYRPSQNQGNPYLYSYTYPNFNLLPDSSIPNFITGTNVPYFLDRSHPSSLKDNLVVKRRKRITKKLTLIEVKKNFRNLSPDFKIRRKTFKYFDPSRAPPITSLRNSQQLLMDLRIQEQKSASYNLQSQPVSSKLHEDSRKLQILLNQPNQRDYPFLICKKRKYHRNLKRRYSVAYFEQRAFYIINKQPIPPELHPKNKVRKPRTSKINMEEISQSSDEYSESNSSQISPQSSKVQLERQKCQQYLIKVENKFRTNESEIKQEIQSVRMFQQNY